MIKNNDNDDNNSDKKSAKNKSEYRSIKKCIDFRTGHSINCICVHKNKEKYKMIMKGTNNQQKTNSLLLLALLLNET